MSLKLTRRELESLPREKLHTSRNWSKADVYAVQLPDGPWAVVKDMGRCPLWFRLLAGRYVMRREANVLRALDGLDGIPRLLGRPHADYFVMERKTGRPVLEFEKGRVSIKALENLATLMKAVHMRGVTHGDLHRDNVLVAPDGSVVLIDWATGSVFGTESKKWTKREWVSLDNRAVAKMKLMHQPALLTDEERALLLHGSPLYSTIRGVGHWFRRLRGAKAKHSPAEMAKLYSQRMEKAGLITENSGTSKDKKAL